MLPCGPVNPCEPVIPCGPVTPIIPPDTSEIPYILSVENAPFPETNVKLHIQKGVAVPVDTLYIP